MFGISNLVIMYCFVSLFFLTRFWRFCWLQVRYTRRITTNIISFIYTQYTTVTFIFIVLSTNIQLSPLNFNPTTAVYIEGTHYQFLWYMDRVFLPGHRQICRLGALVQPSHYADILTQKVIISNLTHYHVMMMNHELYLLFS